MNLRTDPRLDSALRQLAARRDYTTPQGKLDVSRMVSDELQLLLTRERLLSAVAPGDPIEVPAEGR